MRVKHKHELFFTDDEIIARGAKISPRGARGGLAPSPPAGTGAAISQQNYAIMGRMLYQNLWLCQLMCVCMCSRCQIAFHQYIVTHIYNSDLNAGLFSIIVSRNFNSNQP